MYFLILCFLSAFSLSQTQLLANSYNQRFNRTLFDLVNDQNSTLATTEIKALQFLLKSHPELELYIVTNISQIPNSSVNVFLEYLIHLADKHQSSIETIISLAVDNTINIASFTALNPSIKNNINSSNNASNFQINLSNETDSVMPSDSRRTSYFQDTQTNLSVKSPFPLKSKYTSLGGPGMPRQDRLAYNLLFQIAQKCLIESHPNLLNFILVDFNVQMVSGSIFQFYYESNDKKIQIVSKVFVNLDKVSQILTFDISCIPQSQNNCKKYQAQSIYYATEYLLKTHPELISYRLTSLIIEDPSDNKNIRILLTMDDKPNSLRSLSEVQIKSDGLISIESYFTYSTSI